jgi:cobalt/nickel transport system permease protein
MSARHAGIEGLHVARSSPVHALSARVKLVCVVVFVVAVVATPPSAVWAFGVYAALVVVAVSCARLPPSVLVRRMAIELPFVAFALALPFIGVGPRHEVLGVSMSTAGGWAAWNILAKASLGVAASVVLAWSTPVADLLAGLDRLRVPRALTVIAGFMVRYLAVVRDELHRLDVARVSRADDPRWFWQARSVAATLGSVFVRTYERGERVQMAMVARGFDGRFPDLGVTKVDRWWPAALWPIGAVAVAGLALVST